MLLAAALLSGCAALDADGRAALRHETDRRLDRAGLGERPSADAQVRLVMAYFKREAVGGLYLATSRDGLSWREVPGGPLFIPEAPPSRGLRDPFIARGPDGLFRMVWTWEMNAAWVRQTAESVGYSTSADLIRWAPARLLPVMAHEERFVHFCWAPELTFDHAAGDWLLTFSAPVEGVSDHTKPAGTNARIYATRTRDFAAFTRTTMFFDPGFPVIDQTFIDLEQPGPERWLMLVKDERREPRRKQIKLAFAPALAGPWSFPAGEAPAPLSDAISVHDAEAPALARVGDRWFLYYDLYESNAYGVMASADLRAWDDLSAWASFPPDARHACVFEVDQATLAALEAHRPMLMSSRPPASSSGAGR